MHIYVARTVTSACGVLRIMSVNMLTAVNTIKIVSMSAISYLTHAIIVFECVALIIQYPIQSIY